MNPDNTRALMLRRTSLACALLVISVVGLSAYIRLSALGLDCAPWPQCYGQAAAAAPSATIDVLRLLHRITATALLPLLLLLLMGGFARKPERWEQRWTAVAAVAITVFLAVLGRWTSGAKVPAVALGNLLGGFVLFALCLRMAFVGRLQAAARELPAGTRGWRLAAIAAVLLQAALGGLVSSGLAGLSCPGLACTLPDPVAWTALNPWHVPSVDPSAWPVNPQGSIVQLLHRLLALLVVALVALTAWRLRGSRWQRTGLLLLALVALQFLLGVGLVAAGLPLLLALAHNLLAALLLALLFTLP